jgi:transmembrane sensor
MSTPHSSSNRQILEEASAWFVEFRLGEPDTTRRREFMQWLQRSPEHIRAYMEISRAYARLPTENTVGSRDIERLVERVRSRANVVSRECVSELPIVTATKSGPYPARRRTMLLAASISALSVCMLLAVWLVLTRAPLYATATAEHRSITLEDGSKLELNARTKIRIDYREDERHIDLLEGQALFHVAKDPGRPFVVSSAGAQVRAIGTRFDVHLRKSGTTVTVLEGRVAIQPRSLPHETPRPEQAGSAGRPDGNAIPLELAAGEQIIITPTAIARPARPNLAAATAWTQGELEFDETPLRDVVEEFNRYARVPLVIDTPSLEDFRISGVYSSEDAGSLIRFLESQPDLVVTETPTGIRIRGK